MNTQLLIITGPTASGKSDLAIELAKKYNGEIISADSRQIYRGMDLGTGKVMRDKVPSHPELVSGSQKEMLKQIQHDILQPYLSSDISHYLLDAREPNEPYNVTDFQQDARIVIEDILKRGKLPIICGGTGFWIQALIENQHFPTVPLDPELREKLGKLSTPELFTMLEKLDSKRAETIDRNNPVRLIRGIEIARAPQARNSKLVTRNLESESGIRHLPSYQLPVTNYDIIALNPPLDTLRERIQKRLDIRFDHGMVEEVAQLHAEGVSWERLESFGLEYKWIALYLQDKVDEVTMKEKLYFAIVHYAKRQLTWLRRWERQGQKIHWVKQAEEGFALAKEFLQ